MCGKEEDCSSGVNTARILRKCSKHSIIIQFKKSRHFVKVQQRYLRRNKKVFLLVPSGKSALESTAIRGPIIGFMAEKIIYKKLFKNYYFVNIFQKFVRDL